MSGKNFPLMSKFNGTGKSPTMKPSGIHSDIDNRDNCTQHCSKCPQFCNHVGKRTENSAQTAANCDRTTNCDRATNCNKRTNC